MFRRVAIASLIALFFLCSVFRFAGQGVTASPQASVTLSPTLESQLTQLTDDAEVGTVIVAFNTNEGLNAAHLDALRGLGIADGITFQNLGMVAVTATAGQIRALAANSSVRSVWSNDQLEYYMDAARVLGGVERLRTDASFMQRNGGLPVAGRGNFSVMVIDSGVDATHPDLQLGRNVVQNVQVLTSTNMVGAGFTPLVTIENVPNTDQSVGHGTHCAGIIGGTGQASGTRYAGVAPGARLIGAGLGAGIFVLNALGAWEWAIANQFNYNIRVISNSYGSFADFNPNDPINIASRLLYERNVVILFAGANSGPGKGTWNRYAKAPWVIGVAAGSKEGDLANFSSRGTPREERLGNSTTLDDYDVPTITAPGTGRIYEANAGRFTTDIVSVRSTSNVSSNGGEADLELQPAHIPYYTQISGTSMATPYVAGVVALMLDADPTLTPDEVREIITSTATPMPGREDYEVGAGFINAYAAVDKVFNRSRAYGAFLHPAFNTPLNTTITAQEPFSINFTPAALPGPGSPNSRTFIVQPGTEILDVFARIPAALSYSNTVGIVLTDPNGATYTSGIALPILAAPSRQVIVKNPVAGQWLLEVRGVRGLAAAPGVSLPTAGVAQPSTVTGTITHKDITIASPIADIAGHAAYSEIETALVNRRMDTLADGLFHPNANVTRGDFAHALRYNTSLRQSLGATPRFTDVSGALAAIAEAVTANGSTLRDWNFAPAGMMSASGSSFNPAGEISRLDLAVAFVRALGLDAQAKALANSTVTYNGTPLTDNSQIPGALRGYVQIAIEKGFLEVYPAEVRQEGNTFIAIPGPRVEPNAGVTRAALAAKINTFAQRFIVGS